ncbi:MAG: hypothetical protein FWF77_01900, partial [Defluviitaleaceae bacterium]|nr:hypothetical protein [Defluviitaleaceae bacterium]
IFSLLHLFLFPFYYRLKEKVSIGKIYVIQALRLVHFFNALQTHSISGLQGVFPESIFDAILG